MTATSRVPLDWARLPRARTARRQAPTVMAAAAVALVALVACGPGQPARLALPVGTTAENLGPAASRSAELWVEPMEFVLADGVDVPGSEAPAWRYLAPGNDDVAALATRLGAAGTPEVLAPADGGGWTLGGADGEPSLFVSPTGTWNWWDGSGLTVASSISSAACDPDTPVSNPPAPPADRGDSADRGDITVIDGSPGCDDVADPPAPELPGDDEVLAAAGAIFGADATVEIESRDDWYVSVRATYLLNGEPSGQVGHYGIGAYGVDAAGQLGAPEEEGPYRTLSAADAMVRLVGAFPGAAREPGCCGCCDGAAPEAEPGNPGRPLAVDPEPGVTGPGEPDPVATEPVGPDPVEIMLVGVTTRLVPFVDGNGTVWSLPGYGYTDGDDNTWEVVAVAPEYFDEPGDDSDPGVVDPGSGAGGDSGGGDPGDDDVLPDPGPPVPPVEGLSEEAATNLLTDDGFVVRVVERDGEQFQMTMDYRDNRVNLVITNGVVASATVG